MSDFEDVFGEGFAPMMKHLRQTAIQAQIAMVLGSSQREYFMALTKEGMTEDQAFRVMDITFQAVISGVVQLSKALLPPIKPQE